MLAWFLPPSSVGSIVSVCVLIITVKVNIVIAYTPYAIFSFFKWLLHFKISPLPGWSNWLFKINLFKGRFSLPINLYWIFVQKQILLDFTDSGYLGFLVLGDFISAFKIAQQQTTKITKLCKLNLPNSGWKSTKSQNRRLTDGSV